MNEKTDWVRVTPDHLPKKGDELLLMKKSDWSVYDLARAAGDWNSPDEQEGYAEFFRPLNAPAQED
jgi:hypothetical protein